MKKTYFSLLAAIFLVGFAPFAFALIKNPATLGNITGTLTLANGGTATTTYYAGGVIFSDATKLTQAAVASSFFWDNTNLRLGIGTAAPSSRLTVTQTSSGADVIDFLGENLGGAAQSNTVMSLRPGNLSTGRVYMSAIAPGGSDAEFAVYTSDNNGAPTEKFRVRDQGQFGIGTTTGTAILQATAITANATTSIQFGKANQNKGTCMTYYDTAGSPVYMFIAAGGTTFTSQNGGTAPSGCQN